MNLNKVNKKRKTEKLVRTTFTLSEDTIEEIEQMKSYHRIQIKDLFISLSKILKKKLNNSTKSKIEFLYQRDRYLKKSIAIPKETTDIFNSLSKRYKIPRDILIEYSMESLKKENMIKFDQRRKKYLEALNLIEKFNIEGEKIQKYLYDLIKEDDPEPKAIPDIFELIMIISNTLEELIKVDINGGPELDIPISLAQAVYELEDYLEQKELDEKR